MAYPRPKGEVDLSMGTIPNFSMPGENLSINAMMTCTYNESHKVSGGRYFRHIEKCRQRYLEDPNTCISVAVKGGTMVICPYNKTHHLHSSVMQEHITICADVYKWHMEHQPEPPSMVVEYPRYELKPDTEEASIPTPPYDRYTREWLELLTDEDLNTGLRKILKELPVPTEETRLLEAANYAEHQSRYTEKTPSISQYLSFVSTATRSNAPSEVNLSCVCSDSSSISDK